MEKEHIHNSFDELLNNPKSKSFLAHLVRSYMPVSKVTKVIDKPKGEFKCLVTRAELFSMGDILNGMQTEEFKNTFMDQLKSVFDENVKTESPIQKLVGDKEMGVTGEDTTTYMSYITYQEFHNWVLNKIFSGDKYVTWLMSSILYKERKKVRDAKKIEDEKNGKVYTKKEHIKVPKAKVSTFTLSDSSNVLANLKSELVKQEKKG